MTTSNEGKGQLKALATFAAAARHQSKKPAGQGLTPTPETAGKAGDLSAEEKDAADILGGNATGDRARADAGRAHHAKIDKGAD
jgi:hypothetical protein